MINSPLKWVGGKYAILDKIIPHINATNKLIEPFMGSIVVSLNIRTKECVLNDYNPDLVNFFENAIASPEALIDYVSPYFCEMNSTKYYDTRELFNSTPRNTFERACLFLIMNKFAFNGVCRYNKNGIFNVPYSNHKHISVPNLMNVRNSFRDRKVTFHNLDFADDMLYQNLNEGDVVYFDPPYLPSDDYDSNFSDYTGEDFTIQQHETLAKIAKQLYDRKIRVVISNHDTKLTRELYSQASYMLSIPKKRNISSQKEKRKTVNELLAVYGKEVKDNVLFGD